MTPAPIVHLKQIVSLDSSGIYFAAAHDELIRTHDATEQPMHLAAPPDAANHADVGAVDLRNNIADQEFWQTIRIGDRGRCQTILNAHSKLPARRAGANHARGKTCNELTYVASKLSLPPTLYGGLRAQVDSILRSVVPEPEQLSGTNPYNSLSSILHSGAFA